jgi:hypothetical protein
MDKFKYWSILKGSMKKIYFLLFLLILLSLLSACSLKKGLKNREIEPVNYTNIFYNRSDSTFFTSAFDDGGNRSRVEVSSDFVQSLKDMMNKEENLLQYYVLFIQKIDGKSYYFIEKQECGYDGSQRLCGRIGQSFVIDENSIVYPIDYGCFDYACFYRHKMYDLDYRIIDVLEKLPAKEKKLGINPVLAFFNNTLFLEYNFSNLYLGDIFFDGYILSNPNSIYSNVTIYEFRDIKNCNFTKIEIKENCLRFNAIENKDEFFCGQMHEVESQDVCFYNLALLKNEINICEYINDNLTKEYCYKDLAVINKDIKKCDMISDDILIFSDGLVCDEYVKYGFKDICKKFSRAKLNTSLITICQREVNISLNIINNYPFETKYIYPEICIKIGCRE